MSINELVKEIHSKIFPDVTWKEPVNNRTKYANYVLRQKLKPLIIGIEEEINKNNILPVKIYYRININEELCIEIEKRDSLDEFDDYESEILMEIMERKLDLGKADINDPNSTYKIYVGDLLQDMAHKVRDRVSKMEPLSNNTFAWNEAVDKYLDLWSYIR